MQQSIACKKNMLRMWHVSVQNDASIELKLLPEVPHSQALHSPSVTCVLPNTIKVRDWCVVSGKV